MKSKIAVTWSSGDTGAVFVVLAKRIKRKKEKKKESRGKREEGREKGRDSNRET